MKVTLGRQCVSLDKRYGGLGHRRQFGRTRISEPRVACDYRRAGDGRGFPKREQLREALEAVAVRGIANSDDLLADVRSAFLEARQNFAGLLTPPQLNRFIEEVAGPMLVLPDGRVVQKNDEWSINDDARKESDDSLRAPGIAGGGFEPPTSGL